MAEELSETLITNAVIDSIYLNSDEEFDDVMDNLQHNLDIRMFRYSCVSKVAKNLSWYELTFPEYDEKRFRKLVRCSRVQFDFILKEIRSHAVFNGHNSDQQFTVELQLAIVLYRLGSNGKEATIQKISCLFGVGDGGTIDRITERVFEAILSLQSKYLYWPSHDERLTLVDEMMHELPFCVGFTDGTEIELEDAPTLDKDAYLSRNKVFAIKLQGTCDHTKLLRHMVIGYPGSVHDARIFKNSALATKSSEYLIEPQWIAADSTYKLTTSVMTPFRKNSTRLTPAARNEFNKYFSSHRVRVEHVFGIMKEKFPSCKKLNVRITDPKSHEKCCNWIRVCCILHNILLPIYDNEDLSYVNLEPRERVEEVYDDSEDEDELAQLKREALYEILKQQ